MRKAMEVAKLQPGHTQGHRPSKFTALSGAVWAQCPGTWQGHPRHGNVFNKGPALPTEGRGV